MVRIKNNHEHVSRICIKCIIGGLVNQDGLMGLQI